MENYYLQVKNLTCDNCIKQLKVQLEKINIHVKNIMPGKIILAEKPGRFQLMKIQVVLRNYWPQLIVHRNKSITEKIKSVIKELVTDKMLINKNYSDIISKKMGLHYNYLSRLFSKKFHITINQYINIQKIKRAKYLLRSGQLTKREIAGRLDYNDVHHFCNQFKKVTGDTPGAYKRKNPPPQ